MKATIKFLSNKSINKLTLRTKKQFNLEYYKIGKHFVCQPVDKPKLHWREMLDFGKRLAQGLLVDEWSFKVATVRPILVNYCRIAFKNMFT